MDTAISDKTLINKDAEQEKSPKLLDFNNDLPEDTPEKEYDIIVASYGLKLFHERNLAESIGRMCKIVKPDGTLFLVATNSMLSGIQYSMDISNMKTTVYHGANTNLVVAKRLRVHSTNGATNGTTNGADGLTNGHTNGTSHAPEVIMILAANPSGLALKVASKLSTTLQKHQYGTRLFSWGSDISTLAGKSCISLLEFENSLLGDLRAEDFEPFKKIVFETKSLFWVTALEDPSTAMIDGLLRVVRNETPGLDVRILHADEQLSPVASIERLVGLLAKAFLWNGEDKEFQIKRNVLHICRAEEDFVLNEEIQSLLPGSTDIITNVPLGKIQYPVKLSVRSPGMLNSVCMEHDESAEAELEPDFVEIETEATSLK